MPRKKEYAAGASVLLSPLAQTQLPASPDIHLVDNPIGLRCLHLSKWLGNGIDEWVWACYSLLEATRVLGGIAVATLVGRGTHGVPALFGFLLSAADAFGSVSPSDFGPSHVRQFVAFLKQTNCKRSTLRSRYSHTKSLLIGLNKLGFLRCDLQTLFPENPFPKSDTKDSGSTSNGSPPSVGESPLSAAEMQRLASAIKADLIEIHRGNLNELPAQALAVRFLLVSMRSGANTTPLIECSRDCLEAHPFFPKMMRLKCFKRRGNSTHLIPIRFSESQAATFVLPMDAVGILKLVLEETKELASEAPKQIRDRIWLYRTGSLGREGRIGCLTQKTLLHHFRCFIKRHGLLDDNGSPLRVPPQRLRKTKEKRLWRLSDGDLISVANLMGQTPQVADTHYLALDTDMLTDMAQFLSGEFIPILKGAQGEPNQETTPTPSGGCKNSRFGGRAPNDGITDCEQFAHCIGCPNFAIVGTESELHRMFSFQLYLLSEIAYLAGDEWLAWREFHEAQIKLIDIFTLKHFSKKIVEAAKARALANPHRYWQLRIEQARSSRMEHYEA